MIAREGLILLGTGIIVAAFAFLGLSIHIIYPKYRAEFTNGEIYDFTVYPVNANPENFREYLGKVYSPSTDTIMRRLNEMIERENISSPIFKYEHIESQYENITYLYGMFLSLNIFFQITLVYLTLSLMRFPVWAIKTLTIKK